MLGRGGGGEEGSRRRGGPLTEGQLLDLRQARKRHRTENRKKKMLKMDEEGVRLIPKLVIYTVRVFVCTGCHE